MILPLPCVTVVSCSPGHQSKLLLLDELFVFFSLIPFFLSPSCVFLCKVSHSTKIVFFLSCLRRCCESYRSHNQWGGAAGSLHLWGFSPALSSESRSSCMASKCSPCFNYILRFHTWFCSLTSEARNRTAEVRLRLDDTLVY